MSRHTPSGYRLSLMQRVTSEHLIGVMGELLASACAFSRSAMHLVSFYLIFVHRQMAAVTDKTAIAIATEF